MEYFPLLISFVICAGVTPLVRWLSISSGRVAVPQKDRWHRKTTALMGGLAIYAGVVAGFIFLADFQALFSRFSGQYPDPSSPGFFAASAILGTTIFSGFGFIDDFKNIKPHTKLIGQIVVASVTAFLGFRLHWVESLTIDTLLTIVWIVGVTNAFNLIDNMDGLCAGIGLISCVSFGIIFYGTSPQLQVLCLVMAASLAAFLIYNFNPASIFMGDSGSLLIGYLLSIFSLFYMENAAPNRLYAVAVPVLILLVPLFDTIFVTMIRLLSGRKASVGGKDHTSHRLVLTGFSEKRAVLFLYAVGCAAGISAIFLHGSDSYSTPAFIVPAAVSILLLGTYLAQIRVYPEKEFSLLRDKAYTPLLVELTYKKQILLVLLDFFLVAFSYYLSYRLRFGQHDFSFYFPVFLKSLPVVIACKLVAFFIFGVYRGIWSFMSTNDVYVYIKSSLVGTIICVAAVSFTYRFESFSKGMFIIDFLLTTGFLLGTRGSFKFFTEFMQRNTLAGNRVLIYGAGRGGEILLREILANKRLNLKPIGFIDDDKLKIGKRFVGYPVFGNFKDAGEIVAKHRIGGIVVSFNRKKENRRIEEIKRFCRSRGLRLQSFVIGLEEIDT